MLEDLSKSPFESGSSADVIFKALAEKIQRQERFITQLQAELEQVRRASVDTMLGQLRLREAGAEGIRWIERLTQEGKADKLAGGGYPNRYTARAADVLPLLGTEPPQPAGPIIVGDDYALPANWRGKIELHAERIAACAPDRLLTIDAWDQS